MLAGYLSGSLESKEISWICAAAPNAPASNRTEASRFVCLMRISLMSGARPAALGSRCHEQELLHAPRFDLGDDDLVRVAAIHHVDHLEAAELLGGVTEAAEDGAVQFHFVNLARDVPRAGRVAVGIGVGGEQILVRAGRDADRPRGADVAVNGLEVEIVV